MQERSPEHKPYREEISSDFNARMYGELVPHLGRFSPQLWAWGVNFFFVGGSVIDQDMQHIYIYGDPTVHKYSTPEGDDYGFYNFDEMRAHELEMGRMRLPKKWDDLRSIADKRREDVREELQPYYELFSAIDPQIKENLRQSLDSGMRGTEISNAFADVDSQLLQAALSIYKRKASYGS